MFDGLRGVDEVNKNNNNNERFPINIQLFISLLCLLFSFSFRKPNLHPAPQEETKVQL